MHTILNRQAQQISKASVDIPKSSHPVAFMRVKLFAEGFGVLLFDHFPWDARVNANVSCGRLHVFPPLTDG